MTDPRTETRIAPGIFRTSNGGWRVYLRQHGRKRALRFSSEKKIEWLIIFRDQHKLDQKRLKAEGKIPRAASARGFAHDAETYLALPTVKAMPGIKTRKVQIAFWKTAFGTRHRGSITPREITEQLHVLKARGYSGSTVNKYRTALMALWTQLDGRGGANPVKNTETFPESALEHKAQPYPLLLKIVRAMDPRRGRRLKGQPPSTANASRARLEVLIWTGMDPSQLSRMQSSDVNLRERWYVTPARQKGRRRTPPPVIRKPMVKEAVGAFKRLIALKLLGKTFRTDSLLKAWLRAQRTVERAEQQRRHDPAYRLPHIDLKDLRHSFGTRLFEKVSRHRGDGAALEIVGLMLDHAPGSPMTLRYSLGAVRDVLKHQVKAFDAQRRPRRKVTARRA